MTLIMTFSIESISKESNTCIANGSCNIFENKDIISTFSEDQKSFKSHAREILKRNTPKRKIITKSHYVANKLLKSILEDKYEIDDLQKACEKYKEKISRKKGKCSISSIAKVSVVKKRLRLLHVAIIMNNKDAVDDFLNSISDKKNLSLKAQSKWSIAHFAAISSESREILDLLLERYPKLRSTRNIWNATPDQVFTITHPQELIHALNVRVYNDKSNNIDVISNSEFKKRFGVYFSSQVLVRPTRMLSAFFEPLRLVELNLIDLLPIEEKSRRKIKKNIASYIDNEFNLTSSEVGVDTLYIKRIGDNNLGYGLYSSEEIPKFDILSLYEGEWIDKNKETKDTDYLLNGIDAKLVRGYGAYAMDCVPNVLFYPLLDNKGISEHSIIISIRKIQKDELICVDYATHDIKKLNYIELENENTDQLAEAFALSLKNKNIKSSFQFEKDPFNVLIKNNLVSCGFSSLRDMLACIYNIEDKSSYVAKNSNEDLSLDFFSFASYLLNTPTVLARLYFDNYLTIDSLNGLISLAEILNYDYKKIEYVKHILAFENSAIAQEKK